jgi:hypothetical protein
MLSMILQKNDGAATPQINPKGVSIRRCPLKSRNPFSSMGFKQALGKYKVIT